jgi:CheY-like chemotaxis protein
MHQRTHSTTGGASAVIEPAPSSSTAATKTILLLDGAAVFLRFEETILQRSEWRILRANTGAQALDTLSREPVDLLVLDPHLPDLLGEHVIRAIRSTPSMSKMAILIVTATGGQDAVEGCMTEGCNALLYKPVSRQTLCATVEQLLGVAARRHVRTLVRLRVEGADGSKAFFGNTVNLSVGGMLIESTTDMDAGKSIDLRFHLPGDSEPVIVMARVLRVHEAAGNQSAAFALTFEHLEDEDRRRIETFVQACGAGAHERVTSG